MLILCRYNRAKHDGGNAWQLGLKDSRFTMAGCLFRFTGIMADPNRTTWKENNHLVLFYHLTKPKESI